MRDYFKRRLHVTFSCLYAKYFVTWRNLIYTITLLDVDLAKQLDTSLPANLSFVDKLSALNYAVRHVDRLEYEIVTIDDATFTVEFVSGSYVVNEIIDIRTTQYATLISMTSPKFAGQRMVLSIDEQDDICSKLIHGFGDHATVLPTKRASVTGVLIAGLKSNLAVVTFPMLSDPDNYTDPITLVALLRPLMLTV